uniref:Uncharacterized protein n=1 Tax=Tanacetum cinerariifolium TaxID=118510 RepID=A0A6L2L5R1_TANCI|nr:hypothetical protein [Tanacetum cinerariifolium]
MSIQQDIYAAGSESRSPMLNKENCVPWSSRLLWYAKSRPNGKLIYNSIMNGPYVRHIIPKPGDADRKVHVNETFHEQTDDELTKKELKQEIWLRVQQMMKGFDIGIQDKKGKLFNEWERFTSNAEESIESYYHHFLKLMNDFKRNKHFPKKIASMSMGQDRQMQMVEGNGGNQFRQYDGHNVENQNRYNVVHNVRHQNLNRNGNVGAARAEGNAIRNNAAATYLDEIDEVNTNCILIANLQQASTSSTQTDKAPIYDSDGLAEVSKHKDTTKGMSVNTQFCKQSILGKPPSSFGSKLYAVTPFPKSKGLPKIDETHALSKPVTSNLVPTSQESKVMKNDNVIALGMFKINAFKPFREEKYVPNKVRASDKTNPITASQPHVITNKDVNSNSNGLSSTRVDNTTKTRRPQPRSNTKNDRVPTTSKSHYNKNKEVKVDEHPRNLLLSKNKKHMSTECNNVKRAIRNENLKSFVLCWQQSSLAVGTYIASGNSSLVVGMPYAFYSQQSSPKLDAPDAFKFSRIK